MSGVGVCVKSDILRWALARSGQTADKLQSKFSKINQWINGESRPTLKQLESLAKATRTPLGFFFLNDPPEEILPIPHFRTLNNGVPVRPSPELLDTVHAMQRRQNWMREYLVEQGHKPQRFVRSAHPGGDPVNTAQQMRQLLGFGDEWAAGHKTWEEALRALRTAIEDAGILVVVNGIVGNNTHRKLDTSEFRGFVLVDEYAPLMFINGVDGKAAQMFTLAHELAHLFFGSSAAFDLRNMQSANVPSERVCDRTAAEFLVPQSKLREIWQSNEKGSISFQEIARRFKVSELVAARRALDLDLIQESEFLGFYRNYLELGINAKDKRKESGGDYYASQGLRVGRSFAYAVINAAREGKLLYNEAYRLTGLHGRTFDKFASNLEKRGAQP
jgi:Zn-dependent peptidase ImmA (M78 family)/transcriptional regulator with XRE-family HTH domain